MSADLTTADQKRFRHGLTVLLAGIVLMLWAWASWVYRESNAKEVPAPLVAEPVETTAQPE